MRATTIVDALTGESRPPTIGRWVVAPDALAATVDRVRVAIESAGVILASNDPRAVVGVIRLSQASYRKMRQNLAWAAGYNIVAIPLAAGALSWAGVTLAPAVGAILMSVSTIVVALNAQLLRRVNLRPAGPSGPTAPANMSTPSPPERTHDHQP